MPDVDYPVNRSDANDPEPDHSEATQDRRATTSIFDDRLTVEKKRHHGNNHVPDTSRPENRAGGGRFDESDRDGNSGDRRSGEKRSEGCHEDNRSGDHRNGDSRDGSFESRSGNSDNGDRSRDRRYDSIAAAPSEEAVKVTMEARRKMTQAAKRTIDETRTQSPDIRNSINSSFPSEDM